MERPVLHEIEYLARHFQRATASTHLGKTQGRPQEKHGANGSDGMQTVTASARKAVSYRETPSLRG